MKRLVTLLSVGLVAACFATPVNAGITEHIWQQFTGGTLNALSDDSFEGLFNAIRDQNNNITGYAPAAPGGDVSIDPGDIIVGVFDINTISLPISAAHGSGNPSLNWWTNEFTGVFQLQVLTKSSGATGTVFIPNVGTFNQYDFTFGPASANVLSMTNWTVGTDMVQTFSDAADNWVIPYTVPTAADGLAAWSFGFTGPGGTAAAGEGWNTRAVDTLAPYLDPKTLTQQPLGTFYIGINTTAIPAYLVNVELDPMSSLIDGTPNSVAMNGTGQLFKSGLAADAWIIKDNVDLSIQPNIVPEPASLLVWTGLALAAFAARRRRRS